MARRFAITRPPLAFASSKMGALSIGHARRLSFGLGLSTMAAGCLPYAMGSTAAIVPRGTQQTTFSLAASFADRSLDAPPETPITMLDAETRIGISDRSDAGLRITGISGFIAV